MPAAANIKHMTREEREKHLKETIAKKRDQKGTADAAIAALVEGHGHGKVKVPLGEHDEKQALVKALRLDKHHLDDRIDDLRKRLQEMHKEDAQRQHQHSGAAAAVAWAISQDGVTEMPAGSNWGHPVEDWEQYTGMTSPVPWCGCFACEAIVGHGGAAIPVRARLASGYAIIADAHAGANGLKAVTFTAIEPGDLLSYWNGEHIGVAREKPSGSTVKTVEGNTSPGDEGGEAQYNGGCVALKTRSISDVTVAARPAYPN